MLSLYPLTNPSLGRIATLKSDSWREITSRQLPKLLRRQLNVFFKVIAGEDLPDDLCTLLCSFDREKKTYVRTYAPAIYRDAEGLPAVVWGNNYYRLTPDLLDNFDVDVQSVTLEKFDETCLVFNAVVPTVDGEEFEELPLQLRLSDYDTKMGAIKKVVKDIKAGQLDIDALGKLLQERPESKSFKPTVAVGKEDEDGNLYIPLETPIYIFAATLKDFGSHENYILDIEFEGSEEGLQCYAPSVVKTALKSGAIIRSGQTYFSYTLGENRRGKLVPFVTADNFDWPEDEDGLILD